VLRRVATIPGRIRRTYVRVRRTYVRIWRTYLGWGPSLLLLGLVVFVPLGALDAAAIQVDVDSLDLASGIKIGAFLLAVGAVTTTGLLGEVFFSGAVAVSLTHPEHEKPPPLTHIAKRLNYGRLIAVDILYVVIVFVGAVPLLVTALIPFVWFGLAGPIVELEERKVRAAFVRSFRLVRHNFWLVFWILVPIEIAGDALGAAVAGLVHGLLGHNFVASWLAESASNIILSPFFAVAAVLLTIDLIHLKDGTGPRLNSEPAHG
jgi:hypothetical protein